MVSYATAQQIENISNRIWEKHGWNSLEDVNKKQFREELLSKLAGKRITESTLSQLEDDNFHEEIKILRASGKKRSQAERFESCVKQVKKQEGYNPYAVCTASVGRPKVSYSRRSGRSKRSM